MKMSAADQTELLRNIMCVRMYCKGVENRIRDMQVDEPIDEHELGVTRDILHEASHNLNSAMQLIGMGQGDNYVETQRHHSCP